MNEYLKRTWAEIDLDNLNYNISSIKSKLLKGTKLIGVVKADAYGHGDRYIAKELEGAVAYLAVSSLAEALSLRNNGITGKIFILGFTPTNRVKELHELNITQTVFSHEYAEDLSREAQALGLEVAVHIKVDTGMGRIGFFDKDIDGIKAIFSMKGLKSTGVFSHLSSADMNDNDSLDYTRVQVERYEAVVNRLKTEGYRFETHLQNSAGLSFLKLGYDYVRAGIVMYGVAPSGVQLDYEIKPVMRLKSVVSMVKNVESGSAISYGRSYISSGVTRVATVPLGYADGYPRLLSNKGYMLVRGKRAPIIGNICMDQLMLDVSKITDVKQDDIVTVIGTDGNETIGFWELADLVGTVGYEMMCLIGKRVPRVYYRGGERVAVVDMLNL